MTKTIKAKCWGETFELRADFVRAECPIERRTEDGWQPTGRQVADYGHDPAAAMREELRQCLIDAGDDSGAGEIEAAVAAMVVT